MIHFRTIRFRQSYSFQGKLTKLLDRNISLAEAIINWIALGYAEDYRSGFIIEHNNATEKAE